MHRNKSDCSIHSLFSFIVFPPSFPGHSKTMSSLKFHVWEFSMDQFYFDVLPCLKPYCHDISYCMDFHCHTCNQVRIVLKTPVSMQQFENELSWFAFKPRPCELYIKLSKVLKSTPSSKRVNKGREDGIAGLFFLWSAVYICTIGAFVVAYLQKI